MKNTVATFKKAKEDGKKLSMLTAYDYSTASLLDDAGINGILVGDSLGNVILGYEDTISVTMEDMIHHGAAVARGAKNALVVIDMPFMSFCMIAVGCAASAISLGMDESMYSHSRSSGKFVTFTGSAHTSKCFERITSIRRARFLEFAARHQRSSGKETSCVHRNCESAG